MGRVVETGGKVERVKRGHSPKTGLLARRSPQLAAACPELAPAAEHLSSAPNLPLDNRCFASQRDAYQAGDWRDYLPPEAGGRGLPGHGASVAAAAAGGRLQQQQQHQQAAAGPATTAAPAAAAAGGTAARQHQQAASLGRILYVRDSGSEADSDEDPDDDLDI